MWETIRAFGGWLAGLFKRQNGEARANFETITARWQTLGESMEKRMQRAEERADKLAGKIDTLEVEVADGQKELIACESRCETVRAELTARVKTLESRLGVTP